MLRKSRYRILVPVNGSKACTQAFRWACQLARNARADLHAIYVFEVPMEIPLGIGLARSDLDKGERILKGMEEIADSEHCKVNATMVEARNAGPAIVVDSIDREIDLVVVGVPFRRWASPVQVGSTADYILKNSPCQVIVTREPSPEEGERHE